ncbi:MAG TPA: hypothetical protein PKI03_02345 [Pseudomonadota bacterium]|nr:hypothetical protein [Pseudomonadota bacterium]
MNTLSSKFDGAGFALALLLHAAALAYIAWAPPPKSKGITTVEMEIRKRKPPPPPEPPRQPEPEPEPPPPPEPPKKKLVQKTPKKAEAPKPNQPQPPPTAEPPKPVFGIKASDAVGQGISVPVGNTTMADPAKRPNVKEIPPLPAAEAPGGAEYRPVPEESLKRLPEREDEEACAAALKQKWEASETHASGATGEVVLRIELDERGIPRRIKKVKGMNAEVDSIAIGFFKFDPRCRFRPAIGQDGKPAAFVIERYSVTFLRE